MAVQRKFVAVLHIHIHTFVPHTPALRAETVRGLPIRRRKKSSEKQVLSLVRSSSSLGQAFRYRRFQFSFFSVPHTHPKTRYPPRLFPVAFLGVQVCNSAFRSERSKNPSRITTTISAPHNARNIVARGEKRHWSSIASAGPPHCRRRRRRSIGRETSNPLVCFAVRLRSGNH